MPRKAGSPQKPSPKQPLATLATYAAKRDFAATPEPAGGQNPATRPVVAPATPRKAAAHGIFVVQKHAARNLHYDFRLEHNGVLLSWAVPKEPSLDPAVRRLAVQVEDHPLEYANFAGVIPAGNYGAGKVEIWDRGRWIPDGEVDEALRRGRLEFRLSGGKLAGPWRLVRLAVKEGDGAERPKPNWLLMRGKEGENARPGGSGRASAAPSASSTSSTSSAIAELFELATLVESAPSGTEWLHETKWDGYRMMAAREADSVRLWSRSGSEWTDRLPEIAEALAALPAKSAIVDGEVVAMVGRRSSFQALQVALGEEPASRARRGLRFVAFDLLTLDGEDLRPLPLIERKRRLQILLDGLPARSAVRSSPHRIGGGPGQLAAACVRELEGIVSKRAYAPYRPGRGKDWLKVKCHLRQELVIAGFTLQRSETRQELGALLVAAQDGSGKLRYAGRVGTGFDQRTRAELLRRLNAVSAERSPFSEPVPGVDDVHWVRPLLVAEVQFSEWTKDGRMRHPSFIGLRQDKPASAVKRELPAPLPRTRKRAAAGAKGADPNPAPVVERVAISHPERRLFADAATTKLDLARYFAAVWPRLEPHLRDRPLAFLRCPEGALKSCFFQKHWPDPPPGVTLVDVSETGEREPPQAAIESSAGLVGVAQFGVVEIHLWGARKGDLERPDRLVFDLDPGPGVAWTEVVAGARLLRGFLAELGLETFPLLSGGKGVHLVAPILPQHEWATVKAFAAAIAGALAAAAPGRFVDKASKSVRGGRIYVDYLRNGRGATAIAPYSPRARARGPVATPTSWMELARSAPDRWTVASLGRRLRTLKKDPWAGYFRIRQAITREALERLGVAVPSRSAAAGKRKKKKDAGARG